MRKKIIAFTLALALVSVVALALGWSGEGNAAFALPSDERTVPQGGKAEAANTATVGTCNGGKVRLKTEEKRILDLHNAVRKKHGLVSLCVDPALTRAARAHSKEMIGKRYFRHESFDGETVGARLKRFGYDWYASGENIAWGSGSMSRPDDRFKGWMESPGHRANILNGAFREVGVGTASGDPKKTGEQVEEVMYTVDFGSRRP
jgi:uncharacterized protein YkwD